MTSPLTNTPRLSMFSPLSSALEPTPEEIAEVERMLADTDSSTDSPAAYMAADSADKPSLEFREFAENGTSFPLIRISELGGVAEALDFVEGLLTEGGASVIYGPSNCGKSFWILDLAACVATGRKYQGQFEVDRGAVCYVALEGMHGVKNRIEALKREGMLSDDDPLYLCFSAVSLLEVGHDKQLAESVLQAAKLSGLPCRLVIVDTMARAMAGGDENSGKDMTAAVKSIDTVRAATGAHVAIIHHCGKNEALGARGHSSLRAAVDTEIELSRSESDGISTVAVTKQRDLEKGEAMAFTLRTVQLGTNRRGKPITSCVVQHESSGLARKPGTPGRSPICTAAEMLAFLPAESVKDWQDRVKEETGLGATQFYVHKKLLTKQGKIRVERGTKKIFPAQEMMLPLQSP